MTARRRIDLAVSDEPPTCPRCAGRGLALVRVPYGWTNAAGVPVRSRTGIVLCERCDADTPHAAPLITWFHVHGRVRDDTGAEFARVLRAWAEHAEVPPLDERALEDEIALWGRGAL
ncbi:hypothetical protein GCM10010149_72740 [Nonomuraea roseoviolacea subsp. roseoviolacea]|uniref:Restriction alleviation protein, Lar family n=1 Tax=Nonomuraea roseoviolacea subsp. carminata TaxID=160689 RepID=A0ABT1JWA7_9ACTN|nr:DUF6300 family protein [Nonomuraea roseoviolacea]MCP2346051.1 hypothetical protein [Nonomuraea roseoviolacea subsp. carminata]